MSAVADTFITLLSEQSLIRIVHNRINHVIYTNKHTIVYFLKKNTQFLFNLMRVLNFSKS